MWLFFTLKKKNWLFPTKKFPTRGIGNNYRSLSSTQQRMEKLNGFIFEIYFR